MWPLWKTDSSLCDRIVPGSPDDHSEGQNELPRTLTGGHDQSICFGYPFINKKTLTTGPVEALGHDKYNVILLKDHE